MAAHRQFTMATLRDDAERLMHLVYAHTIGPRQRELNNAWALFTYRVAGILQRAQPAWQPVADAYGHLQKYLQSSSLAKQLQQLNEAQNTLVIGATIMVLLLVVLRQRNTRQRRR